MYIVDNGRSSSAIFLVIVQSVKSVDKYTDHMGGYEGQGAVLYLSVGVELIFRVSS